MEVLAIYRNIAVKVTYKEAGIVTQIYTDYKARVSRQLNDTAFLQAFNL